MLTCRHFKWIPVLVGLVTWLSQETAAAKQATLDPGTIEMLSNILESLDTFRNDRLRDLENIRLATPSGNSTSSVNASDVDLLSSNRSAVSEHIKALKENIMGHNPVKKTFGYKVTVYTSPIEEDGKGGKPVLVTQYVGGDMKPDPPQKRADDLDESANDPDKQVVHSSASALLPISVSLAGGAKEGHESSAQGAESDHNRKTEHRESSEKGHSKAHSGHTRLAKGHDHERHSDKHGEHHKETEKEEHRHDTHAHDKGGASQQGIRERTEIEYYEREHFLDTEYDKAKQGHAKTSGVKEHEKHNDHDSHENKRVHAKENKESHQANAGSAHTATNAGGSHQIRPSHYSPPYGIHYKEPHVAHEEKALTDASKRHLADSVSSKLHHSEESKGHRENNHEKDHQSEQEDTGYLDKDKGRRKEGYRERGYKITAEREYFLNDAHHDKGQGSHTSGSRHKDNEGAAHGSKEGERDRGFVKEEKKEEAHDAAYNAKDKHYYDGEEHKEGFAAEAASSATKEGQEQHKQVLPLAPPGVNYLDDLPPPLPIYSRPIVYSPSNDNTKSALAYPPNYLQPPKASPITSVARQVPPTKHNLPPVGYDDDEYDDEDESRAGYVGQATYRKRDQSPLVAGIRDSVRRDVHAKPPTYAKTETTSSEENSVRFPEKGKEGLREEDSDESGERHGTHDDERERYKKPPTTYPKRKTHAEDHPYKRDPHDDETSHEKPPVRYQDPVPDSKRKRYYSEEIDKRPPLQQPVNTGNPGTGILINVDSRYRQQNRPEKTLSQDRGNPYPQLNLNRNPKSKSEGAYGNPRQTRVPSDVYQQKKHLSQPYPEVPQGGVDQISYQDIQRYFPEEPEVYSPLVLRLQREAYKQQPLPRIPTPLEQLRQHQQASAPAYSPVVLMARGPSTRSGNQAVDVWYTRQQK